LSVCFFLFCPSRYDARHKQPRRCVYALNLGERAYISPPDSFSYRSNFRFRSSFRSRSSPSSTTSGDIFYCSGSRQLNHSSFTLLYAYYTTVQWNGIWYLILLSSVGWQSLLLPPAPFSSFYVYGFVGFAGESFSICGRLLPRLAEKPFVCRRTSCSQLRTSSAENDQSMDKSTARGYAYAKIEYVYRRIRYVSSSHGQVCRHIVQP